MTLKGNNVQHSPVGDRLALLRKDLKWSLGQVEVYSKERCGFRVPAGTLGHIEAGRRNPSIQLILTLSELYDADYRELLKLSGIELPDNVEVSPGFNIILVNKADNYEIPDDYCAVPCIETENVANISSVDDLNKYASEVICVVPKHLVNNPQSTFCTNVCQGMDPTCQLCQVDSKILVDIDIDDINALKTKIGLLDIKGHLNLKRLYEPDIILIDDGSVRLIGQAIINWQDWR